MSYKEIIESEVREDKRILSTAYSYQPFQAEILAGLYLAMEGTEVQPRRPVDSRLRRRRLRWLERRHRLFNRRDDIGGQRLAPNPERGRDIDPADHPGDAVQIRGGGAAVRVGIDAMVDALVVRSEARGGGL